jgi:cob(I)alamin adenosyltransferase
MDNFILDIEKTIDDMEEKNTKLQNFILPTGTSSSALAHVCRAIARRVERSMYDLEIHAENEVIVKFLNRLSDFLFSLSRTINRIEGGDEIIWQSEK